VDWSARVQEWLALSSPWELSAIVLALAYVVLAIRRSLWCWPCAFLSSGIYVALMLQQRLYMQVALNAFYVAMAVYGFIEWRRHRTEEKLSLVRWPARTHFAALLGIAAVAAVAGWLLASRSDASSPYLDSFFTVGSVVATWMVTRRVVETWAYWVALDALEAYICFAIGLRPTALLYVIYVAIAAHGYISWLRAAGGSYTLRTEI
jgi:nicotinamide mononucleotide transporter